jgi:glycosyltransferase involved in cell wall biosynthesis
MNLTPDITIVLCTFNRAEWLPGVIASLKDQHTEGAFSYGLVIVDNASIDNTPQVAESEIANANLPMRYVREETPGVSAARNRGIQEAQGEWIAFCDDDQLADPRWLIELFELAQRKQCRVVGGAVHLVRANSNVDDLSLEDGSDQRLSSYLEDLLAPGGRSKTVQRFSRRDALNSGNQMVHRTVFEQIGVYNEGCR